MQHKAVYLLFCKFTLHVSGVNHTHHQEYTNLLLQPPVLVIFFVQLPLSNVAKLAWPTEGGSCTKDMTSTGGCSYSFCTPDDGCI